MAGAIRPGDTLAGRYRLDDLLSESGSGRFFLASDDVLQRQVALHVISCNDERAPGLLEAARRSAPIHDPRVLRVLDAQTGPELCFVVNEWGLGTSLDIALANNGPLRSRQAAWLVGQVADAVAGGHARGVAHGRLVPENVLIVPTGGVRIIGYAVDAALNGLPPGTPEQDVRDLAGLLHAALTGRWAGPSSSSVPASPYGDERPLRPRQVKAGVPRALDDLVDGLLDETGGRADSAGAAALAPPGQDGDPFARSEAAAVAAFLEDFTGDPVGIGESLAEANPVRPPEVVVLAPVPEMALRMETPAGAPTPQTRSAPGGTDGAGAADGAGGAEPDAHHEEGHDDGQGEGQEDASGDTRERILRPLFVPEPDDDDRAERARVERVARAGDLAASTTGRARAVPVPPRGRPPRDPDHPQTHQGQRAGLGLLWSAAAVAAITALVVFAIAVWSSTR